MTIQIIPAYTQVIVTKFLPATNRRGAFVEATCDGGSVRVPYSFNAHEPHHVAVIALTNKMGWSGTWTEGSLPNAKGKVYICAGEV